MTLYQILSLCGVPSLIVSIIMFIFNFYKSKNSEQKAMHDGMVAILHNMVYRQGIDYEYLYNAYHELGGNGTGTEIYQRVKDLPTN